MQWIMSVVAFIGIWIVWAVVSTLRSDGLGALSSGRPKPERTARLNISSGPQSPVEPVTAGPIRGIDRVG